MHVHNWRQLLKMFPEPSHIFRLSFTSLYNYPPLFLRRVKATFQFCMAMELPGTPCSSGLGSVWCCVVQDHQKHSILICVSKTVVSFSFIHPWIFTHYVYYYILSPTILKQQFLLFNLFCASNYVPLFHINHYY